MSPPLSPLSSLPSSPILQEAMHKEQSNQFCYLCHDSRNTIACSNHICPVSSAMLASRFHQKSKVYLG
ncbi:hypothetical protein PISMIDRAFT_19809 [Pisolithus microcarpus 441]|uniref:Uncharacterized protein n=1 Tax=Pisolithus microcarpus 441 TaxID=765257 RepID=A0A0C9XFN7_9AGAM|nr:hypothetical protein PISMIDRAFT_19809 [Pisolithus microcarpus 441]